MEKISGEARNRSKGDLILTKSDRVWCWGLEAELAAVFGDDLLSDDTCDLPADLTSPENLHFKGFVEEGLCAALAKGKPLLSRTTRESAFLIACGHAKTKSGLYALPCGRRDLRHDSGPIGSCHGGAS